MGDYDDLLSDNSDNEEAYYSDQVDSDIEAELYGQIHHDTQNNSISQDKPDSLEIKSVSLQDKSGSTKNHSNLGLTGNNSVLLLTNSDTSKEVVNSTKNQKNSFKKNNQICSTPVTTNHTTFFSSDAIINSNLYFSFESPIQKQIIQCNQVQSENSKRNVIPTPIKRKSDVVSEVLGNIQLKKNIKSLQPENSKSKRKKNNHNSKVTESFVEVVDDSSDSDSDSSIMFLEPDQSNLQTNITKEMVLLSSDSEGSDSSMEKSFFLACQRKTGISNADISSNDEDPWHINSEDKFRTRKQSNRYHDNAVITCSNCKLKGHSAKFCSVPKAVKCFFCGDYHHAMNCKNKICIRCFQQGHDSRHCYFRFIDTCELCRMRGHSERNCPDLWRRYHLTTSKGSIVKGNLNPHSPLYCYTCGSKGHYGAECMGTRTDNRSFPTWTSVISYKNPISVLGRQNERNFQQEKRNFQQEKRNFQQENRNFQQAKRNFQLEKRNSLEGIRFNRTPLFRRRKGNETSSKDTPAQNKKRKKKKNSSKMPPNPNQQSTPMVKNIVQNEVYFPRTPKVTPSSSTKGLSKKKLKKKQGKECKDIKDRHLKQQLMHRIGLHQRLGLPIPSTI